MSVYHHHYCIGVGGMGQVYRATRVLPGGAEQAVACKVIRPRLLDRKRYIQMFHREAELTIPIRHSNIVEAYDCIEEPDGSLSLIMELVEGVSVAEMVDAILAQTSGEGQETDKTRSVSRIGIERLSFDMLRVIAVAILNALDHIHGRGVLHRDISPENVMISGTGAIKLSDFGVAKQLTPDTKQSAEMIGKMVYRAPEASEGARTDGRADLFSFATMMYELVTGQPPFGSKWPEIAVRQFNCDVADLPSNVPDDLRSLLMGLLVRNPDDRRPQTAQEAIRILHLPVDRARVIAELGAIAERLYRVKCARAEERKRLMRSEAILNPINNTQPIVREFADTPLDTQADRDPVQTQASDDDEQARRHDASDGRLIFHRPRFAAVWLAAMIAVIVTALIWHNGSGQKTEHADAPEHVTECVEKSSPEESPNEAPGLDGIAHIRQITRSAPALAEQKEPAPRTPQKSERHSEQIDRLTTTTTPSRTTEEQPHKPTCFKRGRCYTHRATPERTASPYFKLSDLPGRTLRTHDTVQVSPDL